MKKSIADRAPWLFTAWFPWVLFTAIALIASVHRLLLGEGSFNNYTIFAFSWNHLVNNVNLYATSPDHYDLFKYSPTFAVLMAPFSVLPRSIGLICWNLLNMLLPVWAVNQLKLEQKQKNLILFLIFIELLSSVQNSQSNGIMLGLIVGAFAFFEKGKPVPALLLICLGFYIKIFAAVAALMFLFYPQKGKSILSGAAFVLLLGALPLLAVSFNQLQWQYTNWLQLLTNDPAHGLNFSIMTLFERTFGIRGADFFYLVPGIVLLLIPLTRTSLYKEFAFRVMYLSSLLIWVVIFNHKAESPTYCIAMGGISIWFIMNEKTDVRKVVMILAFLLVALSPTDLFPKFIRLNYIEPYALKALMPVVIWGWITWDLLMKKFGQGKVVAKES